MTLWEFNSIARGFRQFHNPEKEEGTEMSEEEFYRKREALGFFE